MSSASKGQGPCRRSWLQFLLLQAFLLFTAIVLSRSKHYLSALIIIYIKSKYFIPDRSLSVFFDNFPSKMFRINSLYLGLEILSSFSHHFIIFISSFTSF